MKFIHFNKIINYSKNLVYNMYQNTYIITPKKTSTYALFASLRYYTLMMCWSSDFSVSAQKYLHILNEKFY